MWAPGRERGVLGAGARARVGAGGMWRKTKRKMRWVGVKGERGRGAAQVGGEEDSTVQRGQGPRQRKGEGP